MTDINTRSYEIVGLLGHGGFGKVYKAIERDNRGFHRTVAIGILQEKDSSEADLARFRDEARILGLLRDRAIVCVEPMKLVNGRWSVVMEFVEGATLAAVCDRATVPLCAAAEIIAECARALHMASSVEGHDGQRVSLIHRDLKPANIQVTASGEVKILDFGIAFVDFAERESLTRTGEVSGTPRFVAPERMTDTARQIEPESANIARKAPGESLRDFAEQLIPELIREPTSDDTWVGQCFEGTVSVISADGTIHEDFRLDPAPMTGANFYGAAPTASIVAEPIPVLSHDSSSLGRASRGASGRKARTNSPNPRARAARALG